MELLYSRWYEAIKKRKSRRRYDPRPVDADIFMELESTCNQFKPFKDSRAVLVSQPADRVLKGFIGNYGKIKGAPLFIAFVGNTVSPYYNELIGYTGEGVILEATALGLATCWVGGMFNKNVADSLVDLKAGEKVIAITPVGYPAKKLSFEEKMMGGFGRNHRRKPLDELVTGDPKESWPDWVTGALEAARLSPSAANRQPWCFKIEPGAITISVDGKDTYNISKRLDCGIAMLHIHAAALKHGVQGSWNLLPHPEVARFSTMK